MTERRDGHETPGADRTRAESLSPLAFQVASISRLALRLYCCFSHLFGGSGYEIIYFGGGGARVVEFGRASLHRR